MGQVLTRYNGLLPEERAFEWLWRPEIGLRFREHGERGMMILEQLFVGTAFGRGTRTEWRPVPVVSESADDHR